MGDFVLDPERLNGRRPGWNEGRRLPASSAARLRRRRCRASARAPAPEEDGAEQRVDFTRGTARRVNYPILSFAGREDHICPPEFQKVYDDAATLGGKDHAIIWGSAGGHCVFTPFELRAVVEEYLEWLDTYRTPAEDEPTTSDVLARCLALPGASPSQCNFDPGVHARRARDRVPARADWPEAARSPLP